MFEVITNAQTGEQTIRPYTPEEIAAWQTVPVPQEVSRFQARAALLQAGLLETADLAVAASGDPFLQLAWKEATTFPRSSPGIAALAPALGLTDEDLDDLFRAAALISA